MDPLCLRDVPIVRDVINCPSCEPCSRVVSLYKRATKPRCRCWANSISNIVISVLITSVEESPNDIKMMRLSIAVLVVMFAGNSLA